MASRSIQIKTLLVTLSLIVATELLGWHAIRRLNIPAMTVIGMIRLIQIGAMGAMLVKLEGGLAAVGWAPRSWVEGLKKGAAWSLGFAGVTAVALAVIYFVGHNPLRFVKSPLPSDLFELVMFFIVGGLIAPVTEELCFRGIVYTFFRRWGILVALFASTAIFVALHTIHGFPVTQIVGGIVFAVAYETSGNLMVPITIHCLGNTAIFTLSLM